MTMRADQEQQEQLELEIHPGGKVAPRRALIRRALTTVGSEAQADIAVAGLPPRWAVLQLDSGRADGEPGLVVRLLAGGESCRLGRGETRHVAGVELSLRARQSEEGAGQSSSLPIQGLTDLLSDVEDPREALALLLQELITATGADLGAVILREHDHYTVAVDQHRDGSRLPQAGGLLSDHIVREVLDSGEQVAVDDVREVPRYARVPSVTLLRLRSVLCAPMRLHSAVLGAVFLGRCSGLPFQRRQADDLGMIAALAVPLLVQLRRFEGRRPGQAGTEDALCEPADLLIGESESMQAVRSLIARVAPSDLSVLILGETGTGKELVARALHQASPRGSRPLITLNCAAVPESLLEAELFGARRGAFTGAVSDRVGRIEQANGSTLFLDELGDMPLPMQAALLRVLEQREVVRLGENTPRPVDFRLIAATHTDLDGAVAAGRFREDLLYRLKELVIALPPLAVRESDILLLAQLFLRQTEQQLGLSGRRISPAAAEALMKHPWPGNVRELRATMRRAGILCDGREILVEHLGLGEDAPGHAGETAVAPRNARISSALGDLDRPLTEARDTFVASYVAAVLERHEDDRERAARSLGISVRSLYRYLKA